MSDKLTKRNHASLVAARSELVRHGFVSAFSPPGEPELWGRPKDRRRFVIGREDRARSSVWHIEERT